MAKAAILEEMSGQTRWGTGPQARAGCGREYLEGVTYLLLHLFCIYSFNKY